MKQSKNMKRALVFVAAAFLVSACGGKGGGGGTVATPPPTPTCDSYDSDCEVGGKYDDYGVFLLKAKGTAELNNYEDKLTMSLLFYGVDEDGYDSELYSSKSRVSYEGKIKARGSMVISDSYASVLATPSRMVSGLDIKIDFNFDFGYLFPDGYDDYGDYEDYDGGYDDNCRSRTRCGDPDYYDDSNKSCKIPAGTYTVTTSKEGGWQTGSDKVHRFQSLQLKMTSGDDVVKGTFKKSTIQKKNDTNRIRGEFVIETVNGKRCNKKVKF